MTLQQVSRWMDAHPRITFALALLFVFVGSIDEVVL